MHKNKKIITKQRTIRFRTFSKIAKQSQICVQKSSICLTFWGFNNSPNSFSATIHFHPLLCSSSPSRIIAISNNFIIWCSSQCWFCTRWSSDCWIWILILIPLFIFSPDIYLVSSLPILFLSHPLSPHFTLVSTGFFIISFPSLHLFRDSFYPFFWRLSILSNARFDPTDG